MIKNTLDVSKILEDPTAFANKVSIKELEDILRQLSFNYYNTGEELVPDIVFDTLKEVLEERDPKNKFLTEIGSPISKDKVELPYFMGSLEKIKPTTDVFKNWKKTHPGPYVMSDKLDGISGLFVKNKQSLKLYTRGDGKYGQDISYLIPHILKLESYKLPVKVAIRGEIIIKEKEFQKFSGEFKNARNAIAGLVNSKNYSVELAKKTEFIGYTVLDPKMKQEDQLKQLVEWKFPCVNYIVRPDTSCEFLTQYFIDRRKVSEYNIDGIVVVDNSQIYDLEDKNPSYAVAFKTVLQDQLIEATVVDVLWEPSKYGYLKPTIQIVPVKMKDVTITYATAHNAKFIVDNKLGPGAVIKIVRSGDVIPKIIEVIKPAPTAKLPTIPYKWNKSNVDFVVQDIHGAAKEKITIKRLVDFFQIMDVKFISEGIITKLVENGFDTLEKILLADKEELNEIDGIGDKMIDKIYAGIDESFANVTLHQLMAASNVFGRGFGVRKLKLITDTYPAILAWEQDKENLKKKILQIKGFDEITATQFVEHFELFRDFYKELKEIVDLSNLSKQHPSLRETDTPLYDKKVVFTGFRDAELEKYIESRGGKVTTSVSRNTSILVYTDKSSAKYTKAVELGVETLTEKEFRDKYVK